MYKISTIFLLVATLNVIFGKALHEILEHHHEGHECAYKGTVHFHESEIAHLDLICSFNFSVSFFADTFINLKSILHAQETKTKIQFLRLGKSIFSDSISLRGPPVNF